MSAATFRKFIFVACLASGVCMQPANAIPIAYEIQFAGTGMPSGTFTLDDQDPLFGVMGSHAISDLSFFELALSDGAVPEQSWDENDLDGVPFVTFSAGGVLSHVSFSIGNLVRINADNTWIMLTADGLVSGGYGVGAPDGGTTTIPEPGTAALLFGAGLAALGFAARGRRTKARVLSAA